MHLLDWVGGKPCSPGSKARSARRRRRLTLERLEERCLLTLYSITDLGTFGGTLSYGESINNHGQVAGEAFYPCNCVGHAFLWSGGVLHDIDALGLGSNDHGSGINDLGQVARTSHGHPFIWSKGAGLTDLGFAGEGLKIIHDDVTGYSNYDAAGTYVHAFRRLSSDSTTRDVGVIAGTGNSYGAGINDNGDVAGKSHYSSMVGATYHAFWYTGSVGSTTYDSYANAIDNESTPQLVGAAAGYPGQNCDPPAGGFRHVYSWNGSSSEQQVGAGILPDGEEAHGFAINSGGVIAGDSSTDYDCEATPPAHAVVAVPQTDGTSSYTRLDYGVSWVKQSQAFGINGDASSYSVIGQYQHSTGSGVSLTASFIYNYSSTSVSFSDLYSAVTNGSDWKEPFLAYAINSAGYIVGQGVYTDSLGASYNRAFLLAPSTGANTNQSSKSPPSMGGLGSGQGLTSPAFPLSGAQTNAPLDGPGSKSPVTVRPEQAGAAGQGNSPAAATDTVTVVPAPAADTWFVDPDLAWTDDLATGPLG